MSDNFIGTVQPFFKGQVPNNSNWVILINGLLYSC